MATGSDTSSGRPQAATIADVARLAGVSRAAVSKVIRNAYGVSPGMRERVESAIERLEYRPRIAARAMRGASYTLGIEIPQLRNDFFASVFEGAIERTADTGYQFIIAPTDDTRAAGALQNLADLQVDGIIAITPFVTREWLERLATRTSLVMLGRHDESEHYDTVVGDDEAGARLAMEHLFDLGHHRIAHLTRAESVIYPGPGTPPALRLDTYLQMMAERRLEPQVLRSGPDEQDAYQVAKRLIASHDMPTAIFVSHDQLAFGVMQAVAEAGLTSSELSVVGYDDSRMAAYPSISLTTVDQFGAELGRNAADLILSRIGGRAEPVRFRSNPVLRVRTSTAPPRP